MKPNTRALLEHCIERGIEAGYNHAHKHTDKPSSEHLRNQIEQYIWLEIDQFFVFDEPST